jgi:hypothetical protein
MAKEIWPFYAPEPIAMHIAAVAVARCNCQSTRMSTSGAQKPHHDAQIILNQSLFEPGASRFSTQIQFVEGRFEFKISLRCSAVSSNARWTATTIKGSVVEIRPKVCLPDGWSPRVNMRKLSRCHWVIARDASDLRSGKLRSQTIAVQRRAID